MHRLGAWRPYAREVRPSLWRDSPLVIPAQWSDGVRRLNAYLLRARLMRNVRRVRLIQPATVWAYNPHAVEIVPGSWPIVYHCVDDLASFPGVDPASFRRAEYAMARRAHVCVASSTVLARHLQTIGARDVRYWPNPADVETYISATPRVPLSGRAVIGFIGALQSHKVDVGLVAAVARLLPQHDFRLVGPVGHGMHDQAIHKQLAALPENVRVLRRSAVKNSRGSLHHSQSG